MNKIKNFKTYMLYILSATIIFLILTCVFLYHFSHTVAILVFTVMLFAVVIPIYYFLAYINKAADELKKNIKTIAYEINHIDDNSIEKLKNCAGFEMIAENIDYLNKSNKAKDKINTILNEILICSANNLELEKFLDSVIDKIMEIITSDWAVFYILNKMTNKLEIKTSKGFSKAIYSQYDISIGEGFIGNAAAKNEIKIVQDLPEDTVFIATTFIGKIKPKSLIIVPICDDNNEILGVFAAASLYGYTKEHVKLLNEIKKYISSAIENGNYYNKTVRLTNELKFQNQLIQNLNDDLENKIKERTTSLNNIINSINDTAIISIDINNKITIFNQGAETLLGLNSSDVIGHNIKIIAKGSQSLEKRLLDNIYEVSNKKNISDHFDITLTTGLKCPVNLKLFGLYNEVGDFNGVTIVIKNMTDINNLIDLTSTHKKVASILFEESPRALLLTDNKGNIIQSNNNSLYALGTTADLISTKNITEFLEDKDLLKDFIEKVEVSDKPLDLLVKITKSNLTTTLLCYPIRNQYTNEVKLLFILH